MKIVLFCLIVFLSGCTEKIRILEIERSNNIEKIKELEDEINKLRRQAESFQKDAEQDTERRHRLNALLNEERNRTTRSIRGIVGYYNSSKKIENKQLIFSGSWNFNSNYKEYYNTIRFDGRRIFISPSVYIDTTSMALFEIKIPNDYFAIRPPYSNNTIPIKKINVSEYSLYNIDNKNIIKLDTNFYEYIYFDSDRNYVVHELYSPNYTLVYTSRERWEMALDGEKQLYDARWGTDIKNINDYILEEFSDTVFDNEYIKETIIAINSLESSRSIITKNDIILNSASIYILWDIMNNIGPSEYLNFNFLPSDNDNNNIYAYFLRRMEKYFAQDFFYEFIDEGESSDLGIYNKGFYIYNQKKIMLMDIEKKALIKYEFDSNFFNDSKAHKYVIVSDNAEYLYLVSSKDNNGLYDVSVYRYTL
jgi:hypothetical protein